MDVLTINTVIPLLHAYGTATGDTGMPSALPAVRKMNPLAGDL